MEDSIDFSVKTGGKKRGRPALINRDVESSFAKTGVIRKPVYLLQKEEADSQAAVEVSSDSQPSSSGAREAVSKKFISVEPFTPRGPKPGQKRKPYKKRKGKKKAETEEARLQREKEIAEAGTKAPKKRKPKDQPKASRAVCKKLKLDDVMDIFPNDSEEPTAEARESEEEYETELAIKNLIEQEELYDSD